MYLLQRVSNELTIQRNESFENRFVAPVPDSTAARVTHEAVSYTHLDVYKRQLPMQEESGLPYQSVVANAAHTCGHDTHTAMLLAAAKMCIRDRCLPMDPEPGHRRSVTTTEPSSCLSLWWTKGFWWPEAAIPMENSS